MTAPTSNRPSLAILMAFVGFLAVGLGAMRLGSFAAERIALGVAVVALLVGLVAAIARRGEGAWVGFAVFGWFAMALNFLPAMAEGAGRRLDPSAELVGWLVAEMHPDAGPEPPLPAFNSNFLIYARNIGVENLRRNRSAVAALPKEEVPKFEEFLARWDAHEKAVGRVQEGRSRGQTIGHALFALLFGLVGAAVGRWLSATPSPRSGPIAGDSSVGRSGP